MKLYKIEIEIALRSLYEIVLKSLNSLFRSKPFQEKVVIFTFLQKATRTRFGICENFYLDQN